MAGAIGQEIWAEGAQPPEPWWKSRTNYYEPIILMQNEDSIQIKYLSIGPYAEHEQVKQLIIDHCDGSSIETSRVEDTGWTTVEAECAHNTDS